MKRYVAVVLVRKRPTRSGFVACAPGARHYFRSVAAERARRSRIHLPRLPGAFGVVHIRNRRAFRWLVCFVAGTAAIVASIGLAGDSRAEGLSLLVFGDAGVPPDSGNRYRKQLAVGEAIAMSDVAAPVHALVLLGDNFYPDGLRANEDVARIRTNLVRPYCRFLRFDGPEAAEVEPACETPRANRRPVPLFATLGNHDRLTPESPGQQRAITRRFFSNWRMSAGIVEVYELPGGVSLVVLDSDPIFEGADAKPLSDALRASRGPWRILAAHHPIANRARVTEVARHERYRRSVLDAVAASGVEVQLMLGGHHHNLQLLAMDAPAPRLHAISGAGSGARSMPRKDPRRLAGFEEPGFLRVDLVDGQGLPKRARLVVTLYGLPGFLGRLAGHGPRELAHRWVDLAGRVGE